jgi:hypothetical protein
MQKGFQLVTVYKADNQVEAELIKNRLEASGIPCLLKYESLGQIYGLTVDGLAEVEIQVPDKYKQEAIELIKPPE